MVPLTWR